MYNIYIHIILTNSSHIRTYKYIDPQLTRRSTCKRGKHRSGRVTMNSYGPAVGWPRRIQRPGDARRDVKPSTHGQRIPCTWMIYNLKAQKTTNI